MSTATANSKTMDGGASIHTASDITNGQKIQHNVHNIYIYVCILAQVNLNIVTYIKITYIWFRIAWHTRDTYIYPIQSYPNVFSVHIYIYIWLTFVLPVELIFISSNASVYLPALPPPKRIHFFFWHKTIHYFFLLLDPSNKKSYVSVKQSRKKNNWIYNEQEK